MRLNVYSQELLTDGKARDIEALTKTSSNGVLFSAVRLFLHSSDRLHDTKDDDDRSAITFWLPKSQRRRHAFANTLRTLAHLVENAPPETGN